MAGSETGDPTDNIRMHGPRFAICAICHLACIPSGHPVELAVVRTVTPPQPTRTAGILRLAGVTLMAGLWLAMVAFSTSGRLHQYVCDEAQQFSHECVLVSFVKHQPWIPIEAAAVLPPDAEGCLLLPLVCPATRTVADLRLAPGRAPPMPLLPS